jgi:hypothetical protein
MSDITLTHMDEDLIRAIEARAAATGKSTEQVARDAIRCGLMLDHAGMRDVSRRVRPMTPKVVEEDSTEIIRRLREGR